MDKYDIYSQDNRSQTNGYVKIGTFPLQPGELSNYDFPINNNNIILDIYWVGGIGRGQHAKFTIALQNSTTLNIDLLDIVQEGKLISNPLAYVRTTTGFDLYARANADITPFLNVKCCVIESKESRFIPLSGNQIININNLNPIYYNPNLLQLTNVSLTGISNGHQYYGTSTEFTNNTITIPNYSSVKRYLVKIANCNNSTYNTVDISIVGGNVKLKYPHDDSTLTATFSNGVITLSGLEFYSFIYWEMVEY